MSFQTERMLTIIIAIAVMFIVLVNVAPNVKVFNKTHTASSSITESLNTPTETETAPQDIRIYEDIVNKTNSDTINKTVTVGNCNVLVDNGMKEYSGSTADNMTTMRETIGQGHLQYSVQSLNSSSYTTITIDELKQQSILDEFSSQILKTINDSSFAKKFNNIRTYTIARADGLPAFIMEAETNENVKTKCCIYSVFNDKSAVMTEFMADGIRKGYNGDKDWEDLMKYVKIMNDSISFTK